MPLMMVLKVEEIFFSLTSVDDESFSGGRSKEAKKQKSKEAKSSGG